MKANVNWKESNIEKQRLIDAGITPYLATKRDEYGAVTDDNGGEKWHIYHVTDYAYWWYWRKCMSPIPNYYLYSFVPTTFTHERTGNIQLLAKLSEEYKSKTFEE